MKIHRFIELNKEQEITIDKREERARRMER
jgi:hypothetical protein